MQGVTEEVKGQNKLRYIVHTDNGYISLIFTETTWQTDRSRVIHDEAVLVKDNPRTTRESHPDRREPSPSLASPSSSSWVNGRPKSSMS